MGLAIARARWRLVRCAGRAFEAACVAALAPTRHHSRAWRCPRIQTVAAPARRGRRAPVSLRARACAWGAWVRGAAHCSAWSRLDRASPAPTKGLTREVEVVMSSSQRSIKQHRSNGTLVLLSSPCIHVHKSPEPKASARPPRTRLLVPTMSVSNLAEW